MVPCPPNAKSLVPPSNDFLLWLRSLRFGQELRQFIFTELYLRQCPKHDCGIGTCQHWERISDYILIDLTDLAQGWVDNPGTHHGIALVRSGSINVQFDAKESDADAKRGTGGWLAPSRAGCSRRKIRRASPGARTATVNGDYGAQRNSGPVQHLIGRGRGKLRMPRCGRNTPANSLYPPVSHHPPRIYIHL